MFPDITRPTIILNVEQAKQNILRMAEKASNQGVRFRPHFKTHQSATIGEYFRDAGVSAITVSSVEMAQYFAHSGWKDITIAFPVNLRQMDSINALAEVIHLGVLVESIETTKLLASQITAPVDVWIEIDEGSQRTGIEWDRFSDINQLAMWIKRLKNLQLKGILTHPGRIYQAGSPCKIRQIYNETVQRMASVRNYLTENGYNPEVSVGDTPGCTLCMDLGAVDEIRPGNFVFYDAMQLLMGVCTAEDISTVVACPVVAKYPERNEIVIYGGAIHLTKDTVLWDNHAIYGIVANLNPNTGANSPLPWFTIIDNGYVVRLTQEHGVVVLPRKILNGIQVGQLIYIIPVHICLTVSALGKYLSTEGNYIQTINKDQIN